MLKLFIVFFCLLPFTGWSKDYRVRLEVKNLPADSQPILLRFYNEALFALDTLPVPDKDKFYPKAPEYYKKMEEVLAHISNHYIQQCSSAGRLQQNGYRPTSSRLHTNGHP